MIQEFKDFINKGSIVDLAVAVVLATAFAPIIGAVVDGVLMQIIAAIFGEPDFSRLSFDIGDAAIAYGLVITTVVNFIFVALAVFFVLKPTTPRRPTKRKRTADRPRSICSPRSGIRSQTAEQPPKDTKGGPMGRPSPFWVRRIDRVSRRRPFRW